MKTLIPVLLFASGSLFAQTTDFLQPFDFTAGKNGATTSEGDPSIFGWSGAYSSSAIPLSFSNALDGYSGNVAFSISDGNFLYALDEGGSSVAPQCYFFYTTDLAPGSTGDGYFNKGFISATPGATLAGQTYGDVDRVEWTVAIPNFTGITIRLGLQVDLGAGPEWVVTATSQQATVVGNSSFSNSDLIGFDTNGSLEWFQNVFTAGVSIANNLVDGSGITIPDSAPVTGYAVYYDITNDAATGGGTRVRMRNVTITAAAPTPIVIPVPSIVVTSGTDAEVSFQSETGLSYQLQKATVALETVTESDWIDVGGATTAGDGTVKTLVDGATLPGTTEAFYRVIVTN